MGGSASPGAFLPRRGPSCFPLLPPTFFCALLQQTARLAPASRAAPSSRPATRLPGCSRFVSREPPRRGGLCAFLTNRPPFDTRPPARCMGPVSPEAFHLRPLSPPGSALPKGKRREGRADACLFKSARPLPHVCGQLTVTLPGKLSLFLQHRAPRVARLSPLRSCRVAGLACQGRRRCARGWPRRRLGPAAQRGAWAAGLGRAAPRGSLGQPAGGTLTAASPRLASRGASCCASAGACARSWGVRGLPRPAGSERQQPPAPFAVFEEASFAIWELSGEPSSWIIW